MGAARKKQEIDIEGRKVALTNLDKVLYPSGFTKGQVIDFYVRICELRPAASERSADHAQALPGRGPRAAFLREGRAAVYAGLGPHRSMCRGGAARR